MVAPVDEISDHDVARGGEIPTDLEHFDDVVELSMDITTDGDGSLNGLDIGFLKEQSLDLSTNSLNSILGKDLAFSDCLNMLIYIHLEFFFLSK